MESRSHKYSAIDLNGDLFGMASLKVNEMGVYNLLR